MFMKSSVYIFGVKMYKNDLLVLGKFYKNVWHTFPAQLCHALSHHFDFFWFVYDKNS